MYDPTDKTNPTWKRYKLFTIAWWLSLVAVVIVVAYGSDMAMVLLVLAFAVFSIFVAYLPCPLCNEPVGRVSLGKLLTPWLWPGTIWCMACGKRLFWRQ